MARTVTMKVADWFRAVVADDPETDLSVHWSLEMLKKSMITVAAVLAIATGATAFQSSPAEAGVTIQFQLAHGGGYGFGPGWGYRGYRGYRGYWRGLRWRHHVYGYGPRGPSYGYGQYGPYYGQKINRGRGLKSSNRSRGRSRNGVRYDDRH